MGKNPNDCANREEVRAEIDRLDDALVDLLAERWSYQDRMWRLKQLDATDVNVPWRNREVIERVRERAQKRNMPPEMTEALWRQIIGWGIQYQEERLRTD